MVTMIDTTDDATMVRRFTDRPAAVAGYIDGSFQSYSRLAEGFPHAKHVSITTSDSLDADVFDFEPGNVTDPSRVVDWVRGKHARGDKRPKVYFSLSDAVRVIPVLIHAGLEPGRDFLIWTANPNGRTHIDAPGAFPGFVWHAHATQYAWSPRGINVDLTLCLPEFFDAALPADPYAIFYRQEFVCRDPRTHKQVKLNERATVEAFDKAIVHPLRDPKHAVDLWYDLVALRTYVWDRAHAGRGKPTWAENHRGRRWQQLDHRTHGLV